MGLLFKTFGIISITEKIIFWSNLECLSHMDDSNLLQIFQTGIVSVFHADRFNLPLNLRPSLIFIPIKMRLTAPAINSTPCTT